MKSNIVIVCLVFFVIAGLFVWGYSNNRNAVAGNPLASLQGAKSSNSSNSLLSTPLTFYDFGMISMKNGDVIKEFNVTNPTDKDIMIKTLVTSCMCTNAFIVRPNGDIEGPFGMPGHGGPVPPANEVIKARESRIIRVVYNPNAHGPAGVGKIDRFITLTDNLGGTLQLEIKANVTP
ncbi:MAG: DUF1573 domain-containing protein [bacterium]|nr:DUF1573 domain-containing protein [bacterium]